jgi:glycosyltransferase involved in cell wall biosynthesis
MCDEKNSRPAVSVVMSVYNGAAYLRESLESILVQEGVDFEVVVVNDGSTDSSGDILGEYAGKDSRLRVIGQKNLGLTRALIRGCAEARGRYIARQDADDLSLPGRLARLARLLDLDSRVAFASSWARYIEPGGAVWQEIKRPGDPEEATRGLLYHRQGPPAHGSVMFRKDAYDRVGGYREEFYYAQDSDLWLRLGQVGLIGYEQEYLYVWRLATEGISASRRHLQGLFGDLGQACHAARQRGMCEASLLEKAAKLRGLAIVSKPQSRPTRFDRAACYYQIASGLLRRQDSLAWSYLWRTICQNPMHVRAWIRVIQQWSARFA